MNNKIVPVLAGVAGLIGLVVVGAGGFVAMQPDHIHMERKTTVAATAADLEPFVRDLKGVNRWSPWVDRDPAAKQTYSDPSGGVGAVYSWDGNDDVGAGSMTVTVDEPAKVVHALKFTRPFESEASATITWAADGEGTEVTWAFDTEANFALKAINLMAPMADALAPDYEAGLAKLGPLVEGAAEARKKAEAEAAAEADAEGGTEEDGAPE